MPGATCSRLGRGPAAGCQARGLPSNAPTKEPFMRGDTSPPQLAGEEGRKELRADYYLQGCLWGPLWDACLNSFG